MTGYNITDMSEVVLTIGVISGIVLKKLIVADVCGVNRLMRVYPIT